MTKKLCLLIALTILTLTLPGNAAAKVYIDINAPKAKRMPVAVQMPMTMEGSEKVPLIAREVRSAIAGDLDFSGVFKVLDSVLYLEDPKKSGIAAGTFSFDDWQFIGAEALIKAGYMLRPDGDVELEFRLYDVYQKKELLARRWKGTPAQVRRMSHMFSNEVMERITGEKGIFLTSLLYVQEKKDGKEIYLMDYDGAAPKRVTRNGSINLSPTWWPRGRGLVYTSYKFGEPDMFSLDLSGGEKQITKGTGVDVGAEFSLANGKMAFMRNENGNPDIYVSDAQGKLQDRLTWLRAVDASPSWSPDGKQLAFTSDRYGKPQVFVMNDDGSGVRRITLEGNYNTSPAWSPKGDLIAFTTMTNNRFGINLVDPVSGETRRLVGGTGNNEDPAWSPDGRFISFCSDRTGTYQIYVVDVNGRKEMRLTSGKGNKTQPAWSPLTAR
jgi:TolB protein